MLWLTCVIGDTPPVSAAAAEPESVAAVSVDGEAAAVAAKVTASSDVPAKVTASSDGNSLAASTAFNRQARVLATLVLGNRTMCTCIGYGHANWHGDGNMCRRVHGHVQACMCGHVYGHV